MNDLFSVATSSVRAHGHAMAVHAGNVANMNTPGYRPTDVVFASQKGGGVQAQLRQQTQEPPPGRSGTDLTGEAVNAIVYKAGHGASLAEIGRAHV